MACFPDDKTYQMFHGVQIPTSTRAFYTAVFISSNQIISIHCLFSFLEVSILFHCVDRKTEDL